MELEPVSSFEDKGTSCFGKFKDGICSFSVKVCYFTMAYQLLRFCRSEWEAYI